MRTICTSRCSGALALLVAASCTEGPEPAEARPSSRAYVDAARQDLDASRDAATAEGDALCKGDPPLGGGVWVCPSNGCLASPRSIPGCESACLVHGCWSCSAGKWRMSHVDCFGARPPLDSDAPNDGGSPPSLDAEAATPERHPG
jgi:hypothetical protein